jgi:DNA-directed RNA polymerase subunit RPC12/RpoP
MSERFTDSTGTSCPYCQSKDRLSYVVIPKSQLHFTQDGEEHVQYFGPLRDYICRNCDSEWLMPVDMLEDTVHDEEIAQ